MRIEKIYSTLINIEDNINTAAVFDKEHFIVLTDTGKVMRFGAGDDKGKVLCRVAAQDGVAYRDGGFDPTAKSSFYIMDNYIVIANDYKTHAFLLNMQESYFLRLQRKDYHAAHSKFPIALFKGEDGTPFMIYSNAWNRVDIVNIQTRQILTADKSLIEEGAEERHLNFYNTHEEANKRLWPNELDYFFGEILVSPNNKTFVSAGWAWGSFELHMAFDMKDFLSNHRVNADTIFQGEHLGRKVCFKDSDTIAIPFHAELDDIDDYINNEYKDWQIALYSISDQKAKGIVPEEKWNLGKTNIEYIADMNCFLIFDETIGVAAFDESGKTLLHEEELKPVCYSSKYNQLISFDKNNVNVYKIC